jgi:hypothetical protein
MLTRTSEATTPLHPSSRSSRTELKHVVALAKATEAELKHVVALAKATEATTPLHFQFSCASLAYAGRIPV